MPLSKKKNRDRMRALRATQVQPEPVQPTGSPNEGLTVRSKTPVRPKRETLDGLRKLMAEVAVSSEPVKSIPLYSPEIHGPGDRVMVKSPYGKKMIEVVIPEVDADGNAVPNWR